MEILYRLVILLVAALAGGLLFAFGINFMIMGNIIPAEKLNNEFGQLITQRAVYVWVATVAIGIASALINKPWHKYVLLLPLLGPTLFAMIFAMSV